MPATQITVTPTPGTQAKDLASTLVVACALTRRPQDVVAQGDRVVITVPEHMATITAIFAKGTRGVAKVEGA